MTMEDCIAEQGPLISTLILGVLFLVSEGLPFIKKMEGNGIIQELALLANKILVKKTKDNTEANSPESLV